jgi:V/A-type H+-transporting ATPase subunit I
MAVLPMKHVLICALKRDRKPVLETLQRMGIVQVENVPQDEQDPVFLRTDKTEELIQFRKYASSASDALAVLNRRVPEKKGLLAALDGRRVLSVPQFEAMVEKREEILGICRTILALDRENAENNAQLPKLEAQIVALKPWLGYDLPMNCAGTRTTAVFVGTLPNEESVETITQKLAEQLPDADERHVEIISASQVQTCFFAVCARREAAEFADALRRLGFVKAPETDTNPMQATAALEQKREKIRAQEQANFDRIAAFAPRRQDIEFIVDYFTMRAEKYEVLGTLPQSRRTFLLEGYVPAGRAQVLEDVLSARFDIDVELSDPGPDEDVPVLLHNNAFASPVESVVESYSMPGKGEIDPSFLVACFYYILFGIMLSDAAYGIIMAVVCGLLVAKKKNMEPAMRKMLMMFCYCGVSTTIFGFLFGSFFGDSVNIIATTFFNRPDISLPALWMSPINEPMRMLAFCFAVGVIHLFVGLGAKFYMYWRDKKYLDALYDVVFWYMLVGGCIVYLMTMPMFTGMLAMKTTLPAAAGKAAAIAAVIGAAGIVLTGGRESKNWFKRILKGIYGVYGISGYLSDILSYSRLLALGLATGVIATVFNKMGSMLGGNFFGAVVFILVFLVGHGLNMAINILGAYVHTNRLTFVEFFGKFYGGGGRKFEPFAVHTKYYKTEEEISL